MALARQERSELADFLEGLTPDEWDVPSLCTRWRVRDVVAHMISYEEHGPRDVLRRMTKARFRFKDLNEVGLAEYADYSTHDLIEFLRSHLDPVGATARSGGKVGLVDALIHHQDIRRPLGKPRTIPTDRLRLAVDFAVTAPPLRGFWHARGVRLIATDLDWSRGRGPEASGPGEAILMTLAGRAGVAHELTGPGAAVLQRRLG
ncbi:maleylpyruvate isomerase family mycothiol-dependent enzyme [Nocardioidaceae bacterium SCSIO 66511]|nr:maleylpyruvate isomerase family mycothiol-dependent enzyme [Nocardioidaceae bacterium SCSIO 66511]